MRCIKTKSIESVEPEEWFTESVMWQTTQFKTFQEFLKKSRTGAKKSQ